MLSIACTVHVQLYICRPFLQPVPRCPPPRLAQSISDRISERAFGAPSHDVYVQSLSYTEYGDIRSRTLVSHPGPSIYSCTLHSARPAPARGAAAPVRRARAHTATRPGQLWARVDQGSLVPRFHRYEVGP